MFRNSQQCIHAKSRRRILTSSTFQPYRSFVLTKCRYKTANLSSRNYYDILGVERAATQKDIRKAFVKLSKEYHPDSNAGDKTLHEKFVKINEAFSILSKESTRTTYDQTLDSPSNFSPNRRYSSSAPPRQQRAASSPFDWTHSTYDNRRSRQPRWNTNESDWGTPHFDKTFFEMLRRRMEQDRQRTKNSSYSRPPAYGMINTYFAPFSIISFIIGFGILIHALQWRIAKYSDPSFATDPRSRSYHAYREWQRLSALKEADSMPMRDKPVRQNEEK